jgi:hypothetical protein
MGWHGGRGGRYCAGRLQGADMADDAAEEAYAAAVEEIARVKAAGETGISFDDERFKALVRIPSAIAIIEDLALLDLRGTQIRDLDEIRNISSIEFLLIDNTNVDKIHKSKYTNNLFNLSISNTKISDLDAIMNNENLKILMANNTQISNFSVVGTLKNLSSLSISECNLDSINFLKNTNNLSRLDLSATSVSDLFPLISHIKIQNLFLSRTNVSDISPLSELSNLKILDVSYSKVTNINCLNNKHFLHTLILSGSPVKNITPLVELEDLSAIEFDDTNVMDLRPLLHLKSQKQEYLILSFKNTPATARDGRLAELSRIYNDHERTRKTLEYLRSLPPWPEPYTPAYTPDGSPPQPIGGEAEAEADEVLVPAPVRAPLEVEVVDGRLRPARPGDGLWEDAHERARQAWQALRDFLADLADIRPRIVNQMPQLERALTRLEDALGADYEAANPIAMGINGNRVIAQAGAAGETMADADAAELREFAAALSVFLERFPAWRAYRDETAPAPPAAPGIEEAIPEIEAITEELREHDAIDPAIPESLEKQAGDVRSNPQDSLATRGLADSLNNFLGRLGEIVAVGKRWVAHEIKDIAGKAWTGFKVGLAATGVGLGKQIGDGLVAAARDFFAALAGELKALAAALPSEFGWLVKFLKSLGL